MPMKVWTRVLPLLLGLVAVAALAAQPVAAGPLRYAGATTLQKDFLPEASRAFEMATGIGLITSGGNTDAGLRSLRAGNVDIAGAGRFLTPAEKSAGLVEYQLGWDPLLVLVHRSNPVANLGMEQLQGIFTGRIRNWKEVGGRDQTILVVVGPEGSGMYSAVQQLILKGKPLAPGTITSLLVADCDQQVAQLTSAVTALSSSMVDSEDVRRLSIGGIEANAEGIASGRYPLIKPLVLVTRRDAPAPVQRFVSFALGAEGQRILAKKFIPLQPR